MNYDVIEQKLILLLDMCHKQNDDGAYDVKNWICYTRNKDIPDAIIKNWIHMLEEANILYKKLK